MDEPAPDTVSVTGTGRVSRTPDVAEVTVGVSVAARSVAEATTTAGAQASAVVTALGDLGIDDDDLQTASYMVAADYDHHSQPRRLLGYRVTNSVRVTVRSVERIGEVLAAAADAAGDAATINRLDFRLADAAGAVQEARALAWHDAWAAANQLAELAGARLGRARRIVEGSAGAPLYAAGISRGVAAMAAEAPIEAGTVDVDATVTVEFELDRTRT